MRRLRFVLFLLAHLQLAGTAFSQSGPFRIQTDSLPAGRVGISYEETFRAAGSSTAPYTWSLASGTLPSGLTLSPSGVLSGIPTTADTFKFKVRVVDSSTRQNTVQKDFELTIDPLALSMTTTSPLAAGTVGTSYTQTLEATGGTTPYTWSRESGSLPAGLSLTSEGTLSGTPTAAGSFNFTIRVRDRSAVRQTVDKAFALTINSPVPSLAISTGSILPAGAVGTAYSQAFAATGGKTPYTWSLASSTLPAGLTLSSGGTLGGTPTAEGSFSFTIRVTDSGTNPQNAEKTFSLTVGPAGAPLSMTTNSPLPSGTVGTSYSQMISATGGTTPYTWSIRSGSLPQGITLTTNGTLTGTPSAVGSFDFRIQVTDNSSPQQSTDRAFTLSIAPATLPSMTLMGLPADIAPTQQTPIVLATSAPVPAAVSGTLTLSFASNALGATDDPMVMFSTGSRSVPFNIPANGTTAVFPSSVMLLGGTVTGTVRLTANVQGGTSALAGNVNIRALPPQIRNVIARRTPEGLRVEVTAYSTERRVQRVDFTFRLITSAGTQSVSLPRSVETEFDNWYRSTASVSFGSSFVFVQTFLVEGDARSIESVAVTLTNTQGSTTSNTVAFSN